MSAPDLKTSAVAFLAWFETFIGKQAFAEINCEQLTNLRAALDPPALVSRWRCPCCKSLNVQVNLPTWYHEARLPSGMTDLVFVETDGEADISWWYCEDCEETDSGNPEDVEEEEGQG
jgi:hypothetical protein